jgi:hypothetical protein
MKIALFLVTFLWICLGTLRVVQMVGIPYSRANLLTVVAIGLILTSALFALLSR